MLKEIADTLQRINFLVMFAVVAFVKKVLATYIDDASTALYFSATLALITSPWAASHTERCHKNALAVIPRSIHRIASLLTADRLMAGIAPPAIDAANVFRYVSYLLASTGAVMLAGPLQPLLADSETGSQVVHLVFYSYAENSSFVTQDPGLIVPLSATAVILLVYLRQPSTSKTPVAESLGKAAGMLLFNVLVWSTLVFPMKYASQVGSMVWLVAMLVLLDGFHREAGLFDEMRDFATWQASQLVAAVFSSHARLLILSSLLVAGLCISVRATTRVDLSVLTHLAIIVAFDTMLSEVQHVVASTTHKVLWTVLVSVAVLTQLVLERVAK